MESPQAKKNLDALPRNATYCSKVSQNELLNAVADVVSKQIVDEVAKAEMFTVIADESRDASKVEQMSICLRYVTTYEVQERFLTFVPLNSDLTAPTLACAIADTLSSKGINIRQCVAQCYDGASVMSGHINGVQELLREKSGTPCIYVHCYAHRVNLVLVDACHVVRAAGDLFGLLEAVHNFITASSLRHDKFVSLQKERQEKVMELPKLSDTRWVCKLKAVQTFNNRFVAILGTLELYSQLGKPRERAEAKGLVGQLNTKSTVFLLNLFDRVLSVTNCLSLQL